MRDAIVIKCHKLNPVFHAADDVRWREPEGVRSDGYEGRPYRTCSYCGSIHPADLLKAIAAGARMHGSDWKYGWPHKFYVEDIPNPLAGQQIRIGTKTHDDSGNRVEGGVPIMGTASPTTHAKWYNAHLQDDLTDEEFAELARVLKEQADIEWSRGEQGVAFRAPYPGYQR